MPRGPSKRRCTRFRVGRVSVYQHHKSWWLYYRENSKPIRRRIGLDRDEAERVAAELNTHVVTSTPTMFSFQSVTVEKLRTDFLNHHENVLRSSVATINRYSTATQHLLDYVGQDDRNSSAHQISPADFAGYLRKKEVAPNGHQNSRKRLLRDKGVQYILEVCRSMYAYARERRFLPPYSANPFKGMRLDRMRIEDAKQIFVFDQTTAVRFLRATRPWEFPIFLTLAATGMRPGELCRVLIDEVDLDAGWLSVQNKRELGWRTKTRVERDIPLVPELQTVLRTVIGNRRHGPVFRHSQFIPGSPQFDEPSRTFLTQQFQARIEATRSAGTSTLSRCEEQRIAGGLWRDAGAFDPDQIRRSFIRIAKRCQLNASCPKSWRHTFATLLQDANVDPLLRQVTLGHQASGATSVLGMTGVYTHSRPETQAREIFRALRLWPQVLQLTSDYKEVVHE